MIAPVGAESVSEVYQALKAVITQKHGPSDECP